MLDDGKGSSVSGLYDGSAVPADVGLVTGSGCRKFADAFGALI